MNGKKIFWILVVGFLLFWLFSDPDGLADSAGVAFSQEIGRASCRERV